MIYSAVLANVVYLHIIILDTDEGPPLTLIKQRIGGYIRGGRKFYIGISSGDDRREAMKRRVDNHKKENNLTKMVTLYETTNQETARQVERHLIDYYSCKIQCINRTGGGGGRNSTQSKYQVYIAFEE